MKRSDIDISPIEFNKMTDTEKIICRMIMESNVGTIRITKGKRNVISVIECMDSPFSVSDIVNKKKEFSWGFANSCMRNLKKCGFIELLPRRKWRGSSKLYQVKKEYRKK